jgi:hypothetical protein
MAWDAVLKIFDLKPRYLFAVCFFGTLLLFLPSDISDRFGFTSIVNSYRGWIGLATLAIFTIWVVQLWGWYQERRTRLKGERDAEAKSEQLKTEAKERAEKILGLLSTLSENEYRFIVYALYRNQQTVFIKFSDKAAQALLGKRIVTPTPQGDVLNFPFTINNFVWEYLQKHKSEWLPKDDLPAIERWIEGFEHSRDWNREF